MDKPKATTAATRKLARLIYTMLTKGEAYVDTGQAYYEERYRSRVLHQLQQRAQKLGMTLEACRRDPELDHDLQAARHRLRCGSYLVDVQQRARQHPDSRIEDLTLREWEQLFASNPLRSDLEDAR